MSYAVFAPQTSIDLIEECRMACKARHQAGDETALGDYRKVLFLVFGEANAQLIINGLAHIRPILEK
jgi:hypothetical protein